jgi:hypothetical protein
LIELVLIPSMALVNLFRPATCVRLITRTQ